jgi:putative acetyltransferase
MTNMFHIRPECPADFDAIRHVNRRAFGKDQEADLVDALRANDAVLLSLVATLDDQVVGHILYSPVMLGRTTGAGLGPMAVLPEYQLQEIGSRLVTTGNESLKENGFPFVVVLGHPEFYPRFGFTPASALGITCQWDVPDDVFMVLVLDESKKAGIAGLAKYRDEFLAVTE